MTIAVLKTPAEVRAFTAGLRAQRKTLALVPTMGFLHEGHLSLMREGLKRADVVASSIFVNPSQFRPGEDLATYPRDFDGDLRRCESAGVSAVYAPVPEVVYPEGYQTWVTVEQVSQGLCGDRRPGHFRGVATIVAKLFGLFRPEVALFGQKDYQQLQVITHMNADLELGVQVVGMPTIREGDGLAMSSRNSYLSVDERVRALALSKGLFAAQQLARNGVADSAQLVACVREQLTLVQAREDYVEVRDAQSLAPLPSLVAGRPARLLVAAFVGTTRLIDNVELSVNS